VGPKRLLVTPSALESPYGAAVVERVAQLGADVVRLRADRLTGVPDTYRDAKTTMALVTASPSRRRLEAVHHDRRQDLHHLPVAIVVASHETLGWEWKKPGQSAVSTRANASRDRRNSRRPGEVAGQ
jgi:hypothetical protein